MLKCVFERFLKDSIVVRLLLICLATAIAAGLMVSAVRAQLSPVTVQVTIDRKLPDAAAKSAAKSTAVPFDAADVAVWLAPLEGSVLPASASSGPLPQLVQRNKMFEPHVLVVRVGSQVQFPNKDPYLHNVFSLFDGKRFDLGSYEAGSSRTVHFDRPGISFLFCNIHPDMAAVVVSVDTPYFGLSDHTGRVTIPNVPNGRYRMYVWYERSLAQDLEGLTRMVTVADGSRTLAPLKIPENPAFTLAHKNKYGQDYPPVAGKPY